MRRRLLAVTADTTLDFVDARALHPEWEERAGAVVDVDTPDSGGRRAGGLRGHEPDGEDARVHLSLELDAAALEAVPRHVDRLELSPADARALAADLLAAADDAEPGGHG
jgi:hypothetical protein